MNKILTFALIISLIGLFVQVYSTSKAQKEVEKCQNRIMYLKHESDSLYSELYPCQNEFDRYREAYHIFHKRNPQAAEQYADIISQETE
jgi:hypothetical protein